jgi:hypothetical protein
MKKSKHNRIAVREAGILAIVVVQPHHHLGGVGRRSAEDPSQVKHGAGRIAFYFSFANAPLGAGLFSCPH